MGLARPSGRGGIDVAHIVTYLVRAQLRQLGPHADSGGAKFRERGIPFARLFYTDDSGKLYLDEELESRVRSGARSD